MRVSALQLKKLVPQGGYGIRAGQTSHALLVALVRSTGPHKPVVAPSELTKAALRLMETDGDLEDHGGQCVTRGAEPESPCAAAKPRPSCLPLSPTLWCRSRFTGLVKLMGDLENRGLVHKQGEGDNVCYHKNDNDEKKCFLDLLVGWQNALDAARRNAPLQPPRWAWSPAYDRTAALARQPFSVAVLCDEREPDHEMARRFADVGMLDFERERLQVGDLLFLLKRTGEPDRVRRRTGARAPDCE